MDFKTLPKIEVGTSRSHFDVAQMAPICLNRLHAHLSGSISRECLHELWVQKKEQGMTALSDPLIEMPAGKFDYDLDTFFPLFSRYIYALCNDLQSIIFTTNDVLQDFEKDGVVYLELRTTPRAMPSAGLTTDDYVCSILECISLFNAKSPSMKANLILSIDRRNTVQTAMQVVELSRRYQSKGVVGIDLCGDPSVGDVSIFRPAFEQAKRYGLKSTVHFAEVPTVTTNELWTLLSFEPDRLGHVIHVPDDVKVEILKRKLGLELCLSCNMHAKMFTGTFSDHHFGYWNGKACPVALSTDDVGVFGSPLSNEYSLVAEHFELSRGQILALSKASIEIIFAGEEDKARLRNLDWT